KRWPHMYVRPMLGNKKITMIIYSMSIYTIGRPISPIALPSTIKHQDPVQKYRFLSMEYLK
ncbi:MAG: hypothetical protein ACK53Y_04330, partial [bacterium]